MFRCSHFPANSPWDTQNKPRITVYGANGFTGKLIGESLVAAGFNPQLASRSPMPEHLGSADGCRSRDNAVLDLDSPLDRKTLLESTDILIQAAGPYAALPWAWYQDLAQWPGYYLDLCGESDWVRKLLAHFSPSVTTSSGLWLPACAFESVIALGLVDLLRNKMPQSIEESLHVKTFYRHENPRLSPGTKATARLSRGISSEFWSNHQWREPSPQEKHWELNSAMHAVFSPFPEIPLLAHAPGIASCASYLVLPAQEASLFLALQNAPTTDKMRKSKSVPSPEERKDHTFIVGAWIESASKPWQAKAILRGCDPYGLTAELIVATVQTLISESHDKVRPIGIRSPIDALTIEPGFMDFIHKHNLILTVADGTTVDMGGDLAP